VAGASRVMAGSWRYRRRVRVGATFSWVAVRRKLDVIFLGIVTLAFSPVFANVAQGLRVLTGDETGRFDIARYRSLAGAIGSAMLTFARSDR
jgi:ABC-type branched-subunit amino acid transport system permease subunit